MKISKLDYEDILIKVDFEGLETFTPRTKWRDDFWFQWRISVKPFFLGQIVFYIEHLREGDSTNDSSEVLMQANINRNRKEAPDWFYYPISKYKDFCFTRIDYHDKSGSMILFLQKISKSKIFKIQIDASNSTYEAILEYGKSIVDRVISIDVKDVNERL